MLMAASKALSSQSSVGEINSGMLLPPLDTIQNVSKIIAFHTAKAAIDAGVAHEMSDEDLHTRIEEIFWRPEYREYLLNTI
jgi:malate dehydrogenase (oxaloacetate-decarboxylating)